MQQDANLKNAVLSLTCAHVIINNFLFAKEMKPLKMASK
jgi:hypothetical protein